MDKKKLIEEGILTQYILGELDMETSQAVEQLLKADSDLQKQALELEDQFEQISFENAIAPPADSKKMLIDAVEAETTATDSLSTDLSGTTPFWKSTAWRMAASIAVILGLTSVWLFMQWQNTQTDLESLQSQSQIVTDRLNKLEQDIGLVNTKYAQINHPDVIPFVLTGNNQLPEAKVVAYMNHNARSVVVNTVSLPDLRNTQSYQLWADVDGEMIDMGVLETGQELIPVRYIDKAESLNITIEPFGGSEHPTVSNLISYVTL